MNVIVPPANRLSFRPGSTGLGGVIPQGMKMNVRGGDGASLMMPGGVNKGLLPSVEGLAENIDTANTALTMAGNDLEALQGGEARPADVPTDVAVASTATTYLNHAGMGAAMLLPFVVAGLAWGSGKLGLAGTHEKLKGFQGKINTNLSEIPAGKKLIGGINTLLTPVAGAVSGVSDTLGLTSWRLNALETKSMMHMGAMNQSLQRISGFASSPQLHPQLRTALGAINEHMAHGGLPKDFKAFTDATAQTVALAKSTGHGDVAASVKALEKSATKALKAEGKIKHWGNLKESIRNPEALKHTNVAHGAGNMLWGAASLTSAYVSAHDISKDVEALRELIADVTHTKSEDVTFSQMMFNELPEPANTARNALLKNAGPRAFLEAVGVVLNMNMMLRSGSFLITMVPQIAGWGVSAFADNSIIDAYKEMKANEKSQQPNAPEQYAKLLGAASEELKQRGGAASDFAIALAQKYATEKLTSAQVMEKITDGGLHKDIEDLQQHAEKLQSAAPDVKVEKQEFSHAAAVRGEGKQPGVKAALQQQAAGFANKVSGAAQPVLAR